MQDVKALRHDLFAPLVGSTLTLTEAGGAKLDVSLVDTRIQPHGNLRGAKRNAFSLYLKAPEPCGLGSGDYLISHPRLGQVGPVHVVRVTSDEAPGLSASFQISFN